MVLLTGHAGEPSVMARAAEVGADAVLGKPVAAADLLRTLSAVVRPAAPSPDAPRPGAAGEPA